MASNINIPKLGRLRTVDLRDVWPSEPYSFTPWLAEADNLQLLAEAIGLPALELIATERQVDIFSADIVARAPTTGQSVLIENQIERTDHMHLGQVLTYAAGLDAAIIVWVARRFTEGHRAALDWLNRITSQDFAFFGLEVEAFRIGDSEPAPRFNVVARPNEWSRQLKATSAQVEATPQRGAHQLFWEGYEAVARELGAPIRISNKPVRSTNYYIPFTSQPPSWLCAYRALSVRKVGIYLTIQGSGSEQLFSHLQNHHAEIQDGFGAPLAFNTERERELYSITPAPFKATSEESDWPRQQRWMAESLKALMAALEPWRMPPLQASVD